ncbi:hypothetical protein [Sporofaciens musculi]|uniref:hypothetical protein n=1 Tax=Sporofaciens musculi TaxID=2681861 RepID=UPI0025A21D7D|nr:hypothetical protein [Sporofaciens musculi]
MYRIGYIDDKPLQFDNYARKIRRYYQDMEMVLLTGCKTKADFVEKIYEEQIDVLLVDYKMAGAFGFQGTSLISYINDQIRDLECFILTAVDRGQITDGLVSRRNCQSKDIFDTEGGDEKRIAKYQEFIDMLRESANVFQVRREEKVGQFRALMEKKKEGILNASEEDEYVRLYKVLSSYGMIEKLPEKMLKSDFEEKLDRLLCQGEEIIKKYH